MVNNAPYIDPNSVQMLGYDKFKVVIRLKYGVIVFIRLTDDIGNYHTFTSLDEMRLRFDEIVDKVNFDLWVRMDHF